MIKYYYITTESDYTYNFTYRTTILCWIILTINIKLWMSADGDLLYVRHEIVWYALWIFAEFTTLMSTNRIEVPQ